MEGADEVRGGQGLVKGESPLATTTTASTSADGLTRGRGSGTDPLHSELRA